MAQQRYVLNSAILFGLIGPGVLWVGLIGFLVFGIPASGDSSLADWLSPYVVMIVLLSLVATYVAAIGPAFLVGAAFGWSCARHSLSYLSASALGFFLGFLAAFASAHVLSSMDKALSNSPAAAGLVGGLSAVVCALVATRRMGANSSFKPSPLRGPA